MIIEEIKHLCPDCGSDQLKRNGFTNGGKQKYKCKACGRYGSLNPQQSYPQEVRDQVLSAYLGNAPASVAWNAPLASIV